MEARKNPKTDAQRDQYLAVCRHTHDNIIFNYGSVENYIVAKNTEINTAESKLQSYYDNPRKGKSRRPAIIAGLENTIFIMKNSLTNALRDLEELDAARATETPQISTETAETVNVSAEGEKAAERAEMESYNVEYYVRRFGTVANLDKEYEAAMNAVRCEKDEYDFNRRKGGKFRTERIAELNRKLEALGLEWMQIRRAMSEYFKEHTTTSIQPPQSPETPQTVECTTEPCKLAQTA